MAILILQILATLVLAFWALQGFHLVQMTWRQGYSLIWAAFLVLPTLGLILPFIAIWL